MPIEHIPDWERRLARTDAFWVREILDRPVVSIPFRKPNAHYPSPPKKRGATLRERWLDADCVAQSALATVMNTEFCGDALPTAWPNLGPDLFSAFLGCELQFAEETSWAVPDPARWADAGALTFSDDNFYWGKLLEMTDAMLEIGKNRFYTGLTDMHPGGDAIAALRGAERLNLDLIESVDTVKALLVPINETYWRALDFYYDKLTAAGQPLTNWCGIISTKRWAVVSNDFSCMISKQMFDDVFLPGIIDECRHVEASIYHLDGPGALHHLDSLLAIEELNAIQWVYGAGHGRASDWLHVYRKCQAAGKGLQLSLEIDEIDLFVENLRPEGLWVWISGVHDRETADAVLKRMLPWR